MWENIFIARSRKDLYDYILGTPMIRYMSYFFKFLSYIGGLYALIQFYTYMAKRRARRNPTTAVNVHILSRNEQEINSSSEEDEEDISSHNKIYPDLPPSYDETGL